MAIKINKDALNNARYSAPTEPQNWYSGSTPTRQETLGRIASIYRTDKARGMELYNKYNQLQNDKSSIFYRQYAQPTNQAVANLQALGFDTNVLNDGWFAQNDGWIRSHLNTSGTTNTPSSSVKKKSWEEQVAYQLYQYQKSEAQTKQAEKEYQAAMEEAKYWTNFGGRNYSDQQVYDKVREDFEKKYPTLAKMESEQYRYAPLELNRAVDWSDDVIMASIWEARNPEYNGGIEGALAAAAMGEGNQWQENQEITALLNPNDSRFQPYAVGGTSDKAFRLFGITEASNEWINENSHLLYDGTPEQQEAMKSLISANDFTNEAETAIAALDSWIESKKGKWKSFDKAKADLDELLAGKKIKIRDGRNRTEVDISALNKLDASIGKEDKVGTAVLLPTTRSLNYKYADVLERLQQIVDDNTKVPGSLESLNQMQGYVTSTTSDYAKAQEANWARGQEAKANAGKGKQPEQPANIQPFTEDQIALEKAGRDKIMDAADVVEDIATEDEQSVMRKAGTPSFTNIKDMISTLKSDPVNVEAWTGEAETEASKTFFDTNTQYLYDVARYLNTQQNAAAYEEELEKFTAKWGDINGYKDAAGYEFRPERAISIGDNGLHAVVKYDEAKKEYVLTDLYDEDGNDYVEQGENFFADKPYGTVHTKDSTMAAVDSAVAELNDTTKRVMDAQQKYASASDEEKAYIDQMRVADVRYQQAKQDLETGKEAFNENVGKIQEAFDYIARIRASAEWLGQDTSAIDKMEDMLEFATEFYDQPQMVCTSDSNLKEYEDLMASLGKTLTDEDKKQYLQLGYDTTQEEIDKINDALQYMDENGFVVPDVIRRNMQFRLKDLQYQLKSFEYEKILTDTDPKELAKTIETGKQFEQMLADTYQDNDVDPLIPQAYGFKYRQEYRDDEKEIYYYLLGKSVEQYGGEWEKLKQSMDSDDIVNNAPAMLNTIMTAGGEYLSHLADDDYGVLTSRLAENTAKEADEITKSSHIASLGMNLWGTLETPNESLMSALYMLNRAVGDEQRINPKSQFRNITIRKESTRAATYERIDNAFKDSPAMKTIARLGYEIYCNRGDSMMNSIVFGQLVPGDGILSNIAGAGPMGATAALTAAAKAVENGASVEQAWLIAGANFFAETVSEGVTYSNIQAALGHGKELTKDTVKAFIKDWLTKSGVEEVIGEMFNNDFESWADKIIMGQESEYAKRVESYRAMNMTKEQAEARAFADLMGEDLHTAIVSYLSAGTEAITAIGKASWNTGKYYRTVTRALQQTGHGEVSMLSMMKNDIKGRFARTEDNTNTEQKTGEEAVTETNESPVAPAEGESTAAPENNIRKEAATDIVTLEKTKKADLPAQTAALASVLDTGKGDTVSSDANAAAVFMTGVMGNDASTTVQQVMLGAGWENINQSKVKLALQNAALGNGEATVLVQSDTFRQANAQQKAQMLVDTLEADGVNPNVKRSVAEKVKSFRITMAGANTAAVQGQFDQANASRQAANKAAIETQKAETMLQEADDKLSSAQADAEQKGQAVAQNPSADNVKLHNDAMSRVNAADESRKQMEQHLDNTKQAQAEADIKANKDANDAMNAARQVGEQAVAKQDQQRADEAAVQAEQERIAKEQQAEAARQQKIADQRSGKTAEESAEAKIRRLAEDRGYTGEQAEKFVQDVMEFTKTRQFKDYDMSKQFSPAEGDIAIGYLSRRFGVDIRWENIQTGEDGYYDRNTNTIYLNSNLPAGQVLVGFALHELTHSLETSNSYGKYHDFALRTLYPSQAELNDAIAKKMSDYDKAGHAIDEAQAERELVAEFTRTKLNDKNTVMRMVDAGLGGKMRTALHNINQFIKNLTLSGEERTTAENLRKAERLFIKAINDKKNQQANTPIAKLERSVTPVVTDNKGDAIVSEVRDGTVARTDEDTEYSVASWTEEEKARVRNQLFDRMKTEDDTGMTDEEIYSQIDKWIDDVNSVAAIILADPHRLDYEVTDPNKKFLKANQDYYFTLDASTLCAKRLLFQGIFDTIQKALPNTPLMPEDLIDLGNMMREMGYETPCGICYVESRRRWLGKYANEWLTDYDGEYIPTIQELTTSDGLEQLRKSHPEAYESFTAAMKAKGSANPKVVQLRTDYRGDINEMTPGEVQKVIDIGGLRIQSFSDFEVPHLIDMMQAVLDMSSQGLTSQAYTKVPAFAAVFGDTGIKINLSEIGKGKGISIDNGLSFEDIINMPFEEASKLIHLEYDDIEGMPHEQAMALRNKYSKNVGTILVGMNDAHIIAAMGDNQVDFIIPFHKSGWSQEELNKMPVLNSYSDYTATQNERLLLGTDKKYKKDSYKTRKGVDGWIAKNGDQFSDYQVVETDNGFEVRYDYSYKTESFQTHKERTGESMSNFEPVGANQYWDFSKTGTENAEAYLEMCYKAGRVPKFSQFLVDDGNGHFSLPQGDDYRSTAIRNGYWKTLIDFKMYDNDGNGAEQQAVTPNVNMEEARNVLDAYTLSRQMPNGQIVTREDNNTLPVAQKVVDAFVKQYKENHPDREYSISGEMTEAEKYQAMADAGIISQDEAKAYNFNKSRPLEGRHPTEGEAQRAFGDVDGMLSKSDEISAFAKSVVTAQNSYFPDTNTEQIQRAIKWIKGLKRPEGSDGYAEALQKVTSPTFDYRSADGQARMVAVMGLAVAKNDIIAQAALADSFNRQGTDLGRALQARKLFKLMTPAGRIASLQKMMETQEAEFKKKGLNVDLKFSEWVYQAAAHAESSDDFRQVQAAAAAELAEQLPVGWKERLNSLRMLSMLANPRTHIRNILGNMFFIPAVGLKNKIGAVLELGQEQGNKTKTFALVLPSDIKQFARQDAETMKGTLTGEAKYNENTLVKQNQKPLGEVGSFLSELNSKALEGEDWIFLKGHYRRALGGWMVANGYTVEQMNENPALLEQGRAYAIQEAQKATYRDFNGVAQRLNQLSRNPQTNGQKALGLAVDAVLPFKKTPANILKRGIEYSPIGLARGMVNLARGMDNGTLTPNQVIDRIASGLSGTAVMALGYLLAGSGAVGCGIGEDEWDEELKGRQKYSIRMNLFGRDVTYTMDWAAPMAMPFFVGAAIRDQADENGWDVNKVMNAMATITEPVFNLSMLDGVSSVLKVSNYNNENPITQIGSKIASNYATSYVPSFLSAIARTIDDTQRKSFVTKGENTGLEGQARYAWEQIENKIPFVNQTNIPVRDVWGNAKTTAFAERLFENFISPGYIEDYKEDPVVLELGRLFDSTGSSSLEPEHAATSIKIGERTVNLGPQEYDAFDRIHGETQYSLLKELFNNKTYQQMTNDEAKAEIVDKVYAYANKVAKNAVLPEYTYETETIDSLIQDGLTTEYSQKMMKALEQGDYESYYSFLDVLQDSGVEDSTIKTKIASNYRDQYKNNYQMYLQTGNRRYEDEMIRIEDLLGETGFDFNFRDWESSVEEKLGY